MRVYLQVHVCNQVLSEGDRNMDGIRERRGRVRELLVRMCVHYRARDGEFCVRTLSSL